MATEKQFLTRLQEIKQRDVEVLLKKAYRGIWETAAYSVNTGRLAFGDRCKKLENKPK